MVSRTFVDQVIEKDYGTSVPGLGTVTKNIVAMLCSITGWSISAVTSDTSSTYNATISLPSVDGAIRIYNSGSWLYFCVLNENGANIQNNSTQIGISGVSIDGSYHYTVKTRIMYANLGGVFHSIVIVPCQGYSSYQRFGYGWATANQTGETLFFYNYTTSSSNNTYDNMTLIGSPDSGLTLAYGGSTYSAVTTTMPGVSVAGVFDASYVWRPVYDFAAISGKAWFGNIMWGGKYTMYVLTDVSTSTRMTTVPNVNYVIDGEVYKGLFNQMFDLRE